MLSEKLLALALIFAKRSIPDRYSIYSDLLPGRISRTNLREEISTTEFKQIAGTSLIPLLHNSVVKKGNEFSVYSDVAKIKYVQDNPSGKLRLKKIYKYLPDSEGPILKQTKELMLADLTSYLKMLKLDKYISISHLRFLPKEVFKFDQKTETMVATHMSSTVYMTANFNLPFFRSFSVPIRFKLKMYPMSDESFIARCSHIRLGKSVKFKPALDESHSHYGKPVYYHLPMIFPTPMIDGKFHVENPHVCVEPLNKRPMLVYYSVIGVPADTTLSTKFTNARCKLKCCYNK